MKDNLWSPWHGCHKCSEGCKNCYVFYLDSKHDKDASIITKSKTYFDLPIKKNRQGEYKIKPYSVVATCFTSDFFLEEADQWRDEAWNIIKQRPDVTFLICTKRAYRISSHLPKDWSKGYDNVILAVTCENQEMADKRLPLLQQVPAKQKWILASPLLENIDFSKHLTTNQIEKISVGGESYPNARVCNFDWVQNIYNTCKKYNVEFEFHQTGSNFIFKDKQYKIKHNEEYNQAKKGEDFLRN